MVLRERPHCGSSDRFPLLLPGVGDVCVGVLMWMEGSIFPGCKSLGAVTVSRGCSTSHMLGNGQSGTAGSPDVDCSCWQHGGVQIPHIVTKL